MRTRSFLLVLTVVGLLAAGACSSSSDDDAGGDVSASTTTVAAEDPPAPVEVEAAAAVDPVGAVTHGSLIVDGRERTYRMYVPAELPDGPVPLVLAFHGGFGWGDQFATTDHVEGLAESNGFVVVHPDGVKIPGQPGGVWNGGICCGIAAREQVDDVAFVDALIVQVESEVDHDIDPARIYAMGHSNGGIMSYRLACALSDRIVAIGVVAGTLGLPADRCDPARPVSVLHVHGDADQSLPLAGGAGRDSLAGVAFPPPHDGFATLAAADGCPTAEPVTDDANPDLTVERRQPCDAGSAAEFVTIAGGPHAWPGGTPRLASRTGAGYPDYDATAQIVSFLLSHPRLPA